MEETCVRQRVGQYESNKFSSEWMTEFLWGRAPTMPAAEAAVVCSVLK